MLGLTGGLLDSCLVLSAQGLSSVGNCTLAACLDTLCVPSLPSLQLPEPTISRMIPFSSGSFFLLTDVLVFITQRYKQKTCSGPYYFPNFCLSLLSFSPLSLLENKLPSELVVSIYYILFTCSCLYTLQFGFPTSCHISWLKRLFL